MEMRDAAFIFARAFSGVQWLPEIDGERHLFVAAAPRAIDGEWKGAQILLSPDGGETWIRSSGISAPGIVGHAFDPIEELAVATADSWDPDSSLTVYLHGSQLISQTEEDAKQARGNLLMVGAEILAFQTATALGDGIWKLSGLQRALHGTAGFAHGYGDAVIGLDDSLAIIPLTDELAGRELTVAAAVPPQSIDEAFRLTVQIPQLPDHLQSIEPADVLGFEATVQGDGVLLAWASQAGPDLAGYEIRAGSRWNGARPVASASEPQVMLTDLGSDERSYCIRARYRGGLASPDAAIVTVTPGDPEGSLPVAEYRAVDGSWPAGLSGLIDTPGEGIQLAAASYSGQFDSPEIDAGAVADWQWIVEADSFERDLRPWDEAMAGMRFDSVEAHVRTCDGREPSANFPGAALGSPWDSYEGSVAELAARGLHAYGWRGNFGAHTRLLVLVRFDEDGLGSWTAFEPFRPGRHRARKAQVRCVLDRWSKDFQRTVTRLRVEARN